jgi:hypothetical protein
MVDRVGALKNQVQHIWENLLHLELETTVQQIERLTTNFPFSMGQRVIQVEMEKSATKRVAPNIVGP